MNYNTKYKSYFQERYDDLVKFQRLLEDLHLLYAQTQSELALKIMRDVESLIGGAREREVEYSDRDFAELHKNLHLFPHSIRTWFLDYHKQEIS